MSDMFRIGSSALNAAYVQLTTTGQNIANANTPGYVRRETQLQEAISVGRNGFSGAGVDVTGVRRVYDQFLTREAISTKASAAQDGARSDGLQRLDQMFADGSAGLGAAFDDVIASMADLTARPADNAARSAVLSRLEGFADRASAMDAQLVDLRDSTLGRMQGEANRANDILSSLASINRQVAQTAGSASAPNALFDQRDKLMSDLNQIMRANATLGPDGTINVTTQRGEPLLVGDKPARLALVSDSLDPAKMDVALTRANGSVARLEMSEVGGSLAGMARFADQDIDMARARIGQMVAGVAQGFNDQQAAGVDANGAPGQPLFAIGQPDVAGASTNTGSAQFSVSFASPGSIKASDYTMAFDGSQYQLTRLSDGNVQSFASLPQTVDGLNIAMGGGSPAAGDKFLLRTASAVAGGVKALQSDPSTLATGAPGSANPASDNRNALALQALGDALLVDGGTVINRYADLVGDIGTRSQSAQAASDMSQRISNDADRSLSEVSGVNLDEEAAHLMQYQQAYQAAAKVVSAANEMFRALLQAVG